MNPNHVRYGWIILCCIFTGCTLAEVKVEVMSERTTLENQILGTYNSLDREMLLAASVRGVDAEGNIRQAPPQSRDHKDAVAAMQVQAFHADDLYVFKQLGWVGENQDGLLTVFPMTKDNIPDSFGAFAERYSQEEFAAVTDQINRSRETIMRRVIDMNETLSEADSDQVGKIFGKMNAENAVKGEKIQKEDGTWIVKP